MRRECEVGLEGHWVHFTFITKPEGEPCRGPAVEYIACNGRRIWMCQEHWDVYVEGFHPALVDGEWRQADCFGADGEDLGPAVNEWRRDGPAS